ncbi:MAG: hypothetical protein R3220_06170 [Balneolaceae bacterium]|nr:hypothetical protein [Balneolaceae bacterium]
MADIRKRKKKLEDDLELLEGNIENRISGVQKKVMGTLEPLEIIKRNPFKAVGTSILIGLVVGMMGEEKSSGDDELSHHHKEKLLHLVSNEVKRLAARKVASYLSDFIDKKMTYED